MSYFYMVPKPGRNVQEFEELDLDLESRSRLDQLYGLHPFLIDRTKL